MSNFDRNILEKFLSHFITVDELLVNFLIVLNANKICNTDYNKFATHLKMWFLYSLSLISMFIQICFATMAVAAALYYLAELVEEYTVIARKVIYWMIAANTIIYVLFIFFENFPWSIILTGLLSQIFHTAIMSNFPFFEFLSLPFVGTVLILFLNHYFAFSYFTANYYAFSEVMAFFTLCLWLVPFALFVSLSANENVLPTHTDNNLIGNPDVVTNYFSRKVKKQGLLSFFNYIKESILPMRNKKPF